jgi:hypothetical protein
VHDVIVWNTRIQPEMYHQVFEHANYVKNARVLSIRFRMDVDMRPEWGKHDLVFPRLESQCLRIYSIDMLHNLSKRWKISRLRILSINSLETPILFEFIDKWSYTLQN